MNKVRIGVVGLGRLGQQHADNIVNKIRNARLSAVCSVQENELYRAKKEWGVNQCNTDYDEMIEQVDLDAVAIISPSNLHCFTIIPPHYAVNLDCRGFVDNPHHRQFCRRF